MEYRDRATELHKNTVLSQREAEVVALRVQGSTYREIGDELGVSPQTVHAHACRARDKAGRAEKTVTALERLGFVE